MASVTFLGTNGSLQGEGKGNTSLLLKSGDYSLLVDVSTNIHKAVECNVDSIVITHSHIDHVYGLVSLLHQLWLSGRTKSLAIYAPKNVCPLLEELINLFSLREKKGFFPLSVEEIKEFKCGDMSISSFETDHSDSSIGILVTDGEARILYTSDTRPIKEGREEWMDVDLLIHEASGVEKDEETLIRKGHSSGRDAALLASNIKARSLMLCHLPKEGRNEVLKEAKSIFPSAMIPEECVEYF